MTRQVAGIVKVRLSGAAQDIDAIAELLADLVLERSAPYPNRRDPGERVYLTVLVRTDDPRAPGPAPVSEGGTPEDYERGQP